MRSVSILVLCSVVALSEARVNYCGSKMCGHTNAHTFCQYSPGPGPQCTGYMDAELSADEKERILARLNQRRSAAASGRLRGLPTAGNMLKLRWVEELSREAQRWADQCRPPSSPEEHDLCRDLYSTSVGQCVASVLGEAPGLRPETMVDMWYMQSRHYRANVTAFQPSLLSNGYYDDFGQILWANAYMVGCGRSRFMTSWYGRLRTVERLVCNFAPRGPASGRALWTPAAPAAACPPRAMPDQELPPLCNFQHHLNESHDVEKAMSLEEHLLLTTLLEIESNKSLDYHSSLDELYLTKLAIITMVNTETTEMTFNSVQKRNIDNPETDTTSEIDNVTISDIKEGNLETNATKKEEIKTNVLEHVNLIGRPKTYKLHELNDDGEHISENQIDKEESVQNIPNNEKDFYADYEFSEPLEDLIPTTPETTTASIVIENITTTEFLDSKSVTVLTYNTTSVTISVTQMIKNIIASLNALNITNDTANENYKDIKIEDYFSDPETVRQLQEELERMENALSTPMSTAGKVRRELRSFPKETNEDDMKDVGDPERSQPREIVAIFDKGGNETDNRTPMLNMVMKYMPYLKDYQTSMMKSRGDVIYPSVTIMCSFVFNLFCV